MTTSADIRKALAILNTLADDLPDGMGAEARELYLEFQTERATRQPLDIAAWTEAINDLCASWGFPSPLLPLVPGDYGRRAEDVSREMCQRSPGAFWGSKPRGEAKP